MHKHVPSQRAHLTVGLQGLHIFLNIFCLPGKTAVGAVRPLCPKASSGPQQLPQHVGQDAAVAVVIHLDGGVDA